MSNINYEVGNTAFSVFNNISTRINNISARINNINQYIYLLRVSNVIGIIVRFKFGVYCFS